jgi:hypothetical protein
MEQPDQLSIDLQEAISKVIRKHGYFYDSFGSISLNSGTAGACNNGGISVVYKINRNTHNVDKTKAYKLLSGMYSFRPNWELDDNSWIHQAGRALREQLNLDDHDAWELCKQAWAEAVYPQSVKDVDFGFPEPPEV